MPLRNYSLTILRVKEFPSYRDICVIMLCVFSSSGMLEPLLEVF